MHEYFSKNLFSFVKNLPELDKKRNYPCYPTNIIPSVFLLYQVLCYP